MTALVLHWGNLGSAPQYTLYTTFFQDCICFCILSKGFVISESDSIPAFVQLSLFFWKTWQMGKQHISQEMQRIWDFPYFPTNELVCHSFIDAGRRQEIPGSKTKAFMNHGTTNNVSFMFTRFLPSQVPQGWYGAAHVDTVYVVGLWSSWGALSFGNAEFRVSQYFIVGCKLICSHFTLHR